MRYEISRLRSTVLCKGIMLLGFLKTSAQDFYFGADLSYVNEMEDCGAVYTVESEARDPYVIFKEHGTNLVRLRLWHTPSWYDNLNDGIRYSDFADVRQSIIRAKEQGMDVLLDFHLSDNWADPAHQVAPAAWTSVLDDLPELQDSLYNYISSTLMKLAAEDLSPAIVQIGNETNKGILQSQEQNDAGWWLHWPRNSALFNTAIDAIHDVAAATGDSIKIAIHIADPGDVIWLADQFWDNGVQDFDIIGISYYASYHQLSIASAGNIIQTVKQTYPGKEVMLFETAYPWTLTGEDSANNLLSGVPGYTPSPANQKQWMIDLAQTVIDKGGSGIVYWEPAWVSTSCSTQWAPGSHWENATFFDFNNNLHADGGMEWMTYSYEFPTGIKDAVDADSHFEIYSDGKALYIKKVEDLNVDGPVQIDIWSIDGKLSWSDEIPLDGIMERINIDDIGAGIYLVRIYTSEDVYDVEKIVFANK